MCSAGRGGRRGASRRRRRGCQGFGTGAGCFRGNLTHHELGVLLRLGLEGLLAGGQPASGSGEGPARNVGSHCCGGWCRGAEEREVWCCWFGEELGGDGRARLDVLSYDRFRQSRSSMAWRLIT